MVRKFYLNNEETTISAILEHLEDLLLYNGNSTMWDIFGISFEDVDIDEIEIDEFEVGG